jgi:hypothetical protein
MFLRVSSIALLIGLVTAPIAQAQDLKAAETFVKALYIPYKAKSHPIAMTSPKAATILEASLIALLKTDEKLLHGEVGGLEVDPICQCQDYDIRSVAVTTAADGDGKAKATASFHNLDVDTKVDFDLVAVGGGWRIFDIHSSDMPSLRKLLEDDIAMMKEEQAKEAKAKH